MTAMTPAETVDDLLRSRELLEAVLDHAPGFIIAIDEGGRIQYINRVLPQYDRRDVIGAHWLQFMPPEQHDALRGRFQEILATGSSTTYETSVQGPDGGKMWMTTNMSAMRRAGCVVGAVVVAQEITELRRTQHEFAAAQRLAAVGTLAAGIAHEINTPVQFVGDSLEFLHEGMHGLLSVVEDLRKVATLAAAETPSPAMTQALALVTEVEEAADLPYLQENLVAAFDRCVDGLGRVAAIVRSVRDFAHPAAHDAAPADLNRAIENTLALTRNEYQAVATLETELGELPTVTCHVDQINQVVLNLVVNAAHSMADVVGAGGPRGRLHVRTSLEGGDVLIAISDTGTGIPEGVRERIFEPFFTTKDVGKGTGQGLALAWKVVTENHGGTLSYETALGRGTTFFVRLPTAAR